MKRRLLVWGIPAAFYALFCVWYTDLAGPLEPEEIVRFQAALEPSGLGPEALARLREFMENDTGRQFLMVNLLDMAEAPPDVEGAEPGETAEQLMGRYMEHMYVELFRRACHPVLVGDAVHTSMDLVGIEGAEEWDLAALFRYRSRRSFMEIVSNPETLGRHEFKVAALVKTIAFPIETRLYLGDPRLLLGLILLAGTALADLAWYARDLPKSAREGS
jgi:hypothetical protein